MDIRTLAFQAPGGKPLLWKRPLCDCHWFYQFYLCGCPDQTAPGEGGRTEHQLSYAGCPIWHMPKIEQAVHLRSGFRHNPSPPVRLEPSILPFPCYRHLMESRAFLSPAELHAARKRLMDPKWNPAGAARANGNVRKLQRFQQEGKTWEAKKRVREEEDGRLPPPPPRRRKVFRSEPVEVAQLRPELKALELQRRLLIQHSKSPAPGVQDEPSSPVSHRTRRATAWRTVSGQAPRTDGSRTVAVPDDWDEEEEDSENEDKEPSPPPQTPALGTTLAHLAALKASHQPLDSAGRPLPRTIPSQMQPPRPIPNTPPPPPPQPPSTPSSSRPPKNHYTSLTWLLDEQATDLWRLDNYHTHLRPQKDTQKTEEQAKETKKKREKDRLVLDACYDGPTHTGYFGGAYKIDAEVLHQARIANWHPSGGQGGLDLARAVGDLWAGWVARGGWWVGGRLTM